jgi:hypothetical protein
MTAAEAEKVMLCSWISREQRDQQQLAIKADRSLSAEVRRAVSEHLERATRHDPEETAA